MSGAQFVMDAEKKDGYWVGANSGHRLYGCAKRGCDAVNADYESFGAYGKGWCLHHRPLRARIRVWWQERRT